MAPLERYCFVCCSMFPWARSAGRRSALGVSRGCGRRLSVKDIKCTAERVGSEDKEGFSALLVCPLAHATNGM